MFYCTMKQKWITKDFSAAFFLSKNTKVIYRKLVRSI